MDKIIDFEIYTDPQNTLALVRLVNGNRINLFCRCIGSCQNPQSCTEKMEEKIKARNSSNFEINDPDFSIVYLERTANNGFRANNKLSS